MWFSNDGKIDLTVNSNSNSNSNSNTHTHTHARTHTHKQTASALLNKLAPVITHATGLSRHSKNNMPSISFLHLYNYKLLWCAWPIDIEKESVAWPNWSWISQEQLFGFSHDQKNIRSITLTIFLCNCSKCKLDWICLRSIQDGSCTTKQYYIKI